MKKDVVIFGSGISGCTIGRLFADNGYHVTIYEKRTHVGGNVYDKFNRHGVREQVYGPHIFHTNNKSVFDFLSRFTDWVPYNHTVEGNVFGIFTPIPFNFSSIDKHFSEDLAKQMKEKLIEKFGEDKSIPISELLECKDEYLSTLAKFIYKNIFEKYSKKQWGLSASKLNQAVTSRVPVYTSYKNTYFRDTYQCQPLNGYSLMIENMLAHPNISIYLNSTKKLDVNELNDDTIYIYCGSIDEIFDYHFGRLNYRSLKFKFKTLNKKEYQHLAVINYNTSKRFTRITEFKKLTMQDFPKTTICKEYPCSLKKGKEPYYPMTSEEDIKLYERYKVLCEDYQNLFFLGRLGTYKYLNMDAAVEQAIALFNYISKDVEIKEIERCDMI